jgi:hypothetical protein
VGYSGFTNFQVDACVSFLGSLRRAENVPNIPGFVGVLKVQLKIPRGILVWPEMSPPFAKAHKSFRQLFSPICRRFIHRRAVGRAHLFLGVRLPLGNWLKR